MFSSVLSAAITGVEVCRVLVEADVSNGLPGFSMVGFVSAQVKEAQDRVRTALRNIGFAMPPRRITINLAPADLRKEGSAFDLPVAAAILIASGRIPRDSLENVMVVGELGLDGSVRRIPGVLPVVLMAEAEGCRACIVPAGNIREGRIAGSLPVIGIENLRQLIDFCKDGALPPQMESEEATAGKVETCEAGDLSAEDFADIGGQETVKRAIILAAAGFHNILMIGQPGSGKTMAARRIPGILPDLTREESLEVMKIQSIAQILPAGAPALTKRPFRAPHHTITRQALIGGGRIPKPGEVTLAHRGALFLDELAEMPRCVLETLRQPLEEKEVVITRLAGDYRFPADFLLVAAMNSCPCGCYPDMNRCTCTQAQIDQYRNRISQPILERIDLSVEMSAVPYRDLLKGGGTGSAQMKEMVLQAREIQEKRYRGTGIRFNSELKPADLRAYCLMEPEAGQLLSEAYRILKMSARVCHSAIKTARTAADLAGSDRIGKAHISEALCFRSVDRSTWRA